MDGLVSDIIKNSFVRQEVLDLIECCRTFNAFDAVNSIKSGLSENVSWLYLCIKKRNIEKAELFMSVFKKSVALMNTDITLAADTMELELLPILDEYIAQIAVYEIDTNDGMWKVKSTTSGFFTLQNNDRNQLIHSCIDPMQEALSQAKRIMEPEYSCYVIVGCGLGYLPFQLFKLTHGSARIVVFENNEDIINLAYEFGLLSYIYDDKLEVYSFDTYDDCIEFAEKNNGLLHLYRPLLEVEFSDSDRIEYVSAYINQNTGLVFNNICRINFNRNVDNNTRFISQLKTINWNNEFIIVAAGPSLDDNIAYLKHNKGKKTIIAVGTVLKKLISLGIKPDIVVFMDPQDITYNQIDNIEDVNIPIIVSADCTYKIKEKYGDDIYVALTEACSKDVLMYSRYLDEPIITDVGGTVSVFATAVAVFLDATTIDLVGVDFAFSNNQSHATGTKETTDASDRINLYVESVSGDMVGTSSNLNCYLKDMEKIIAKNKSIIFYNRSKSGAKIIGARSIQ